MKLGLTAALISIIVFSLSAQKQNNLLLGGNIKHSDSIALTSACIQVFDSNLHLIEQHNTDASGQFSFILMFDSKFDLVFSAENHETKVIEVDTHGVPAFEQEWGYEYSGFTVHLNPIRRKPEPRRVARIYYNKSIENFDTERYSPGDD